MGKGRKACSLLAAIARVCSSTTPHAVHDEMLVASSMDELQEVVRMLVDAGAGVSEQDQDGLTALMNAAEIGAAEIVTYLLNKG